MTYYDVMEISEKASAEVVKGAYNALVKKYHPDRNPNLEDLKMKQINEAYEVLSNPAKRREYDSALKKQRYLEKQKAEKTQTTNIFSSTQMITPEYVHNYPLPAAKGQGYDMLAVDLCLEEIEAGIKDYQEEIITLKSKIRVLVDEIDRLRALTNY